MSIERQYAIINAAGGWTSPGHLPYETMLIHDQFVALGWIQWIAADPGQIGWFVQGYYTVGRDMVKGY